MDALTFLSTQVPLFAGVSVEALTALAVHSKLEKFNPGQIVLRAGMTVDDLYVIAVGKAEVHVKVAGKGTACVAELGPGDIFGEVSIIEKSVAGATIKAGAAGAVVLLVPEAPFRDLIAGNQEFSARMSALIAARRAPPPKAASA